MQTAKKGGLLLHLDHDPRAVTLFRAMDRMRKAWQGLTPCAQVSKAQFFLMMTIVHAHTPDHPFGSAQMDNCVPLSTLAALSHQSLPAISQRVSALEEMGYLRRMADQADRRVTGVQLTASGVTLLEKVHCGFAQKLNNALAVISEAEMEMLLSLITKLADSLERLNATDAPQQSQGE